MIKIMGATVLVLAFAVAVQAGGHATAHFTASPSAYSQTGGAGIPDTGGFGPLPYIPPTQLAVQAVSGSTSEYVPSTFVSYDSAVREGRAATQSRPEALGTSARESGQSMVNNAKISSGHTQHRRTKTHR